MSTISVPTSNLSPAEKSVLEKAFDADVVLYMKKQKSPGSSITNWGGSSSGCATPTRTGRKKPAKKKAAKKRPAKKAAKKSSKKKR